MTFNVLASPAATGQSKQMVWYVPHVRMIRGVVRNPNQAGKTQPSTLSTITKDKGMKEINLFNLTGINGSLFLVLVFCLPLAFCGEPDLVDGIVSNLQCGEWL